MSDNAQYRDRIGNSSHQYASNQLTDTGDAVSETLRLWRELYQTAVAGEDESLIGKWAELASATIHYSAALAANYGAFITALGTPLLPGHVDSHRPQREIDLPNAPKPACIFARRVGNAHPLPVACVSLRPTPSNARPDKWTVTFDLHNNPQKGTYYFRIDPGSGAAPIDFHEYLDPTP